MLRSEPCGAPLAEERVRLQVGAAALPALHDALDRFWGRAGSALSAPARSRWQLEFATAVLEIAANIIRHAYPSGQRPARFSLRLRLFPDCAEAVLTDWGAALPAAPAARPLPDPLAVDWADLPETGMGLAVAQAAADEVGYQRAGDANVWRIAKRFPQR